MAATDIIGMRVTFRGGVTRDMNEVGTITGRPIVAYVTVTWDSGRTSTERLEDLMEDHSPVPETPPSRERIRLVVEVDLDPMPGMFHEAEDHRANLDRFLNATMPHYHPTVVLEPQIDVNDWGQLVSVAGDDVPCPQADGNEWVWDEEHNCNRRAHDFTISHNGRCSWCGATEH